MIIAMLLTILAFIISLTSLVFGFGVMTLILISMPVLILIGYLNESLYINDKHIKPFYIK